LVRITNVAERRPYGTGNLVERPAGSGKWHLRVFVGKDPLTGKYRRKNFTFEAKGRRAAERRGAEFIRVLEQEAPLGSSITVEQLLNEFMAFSETRDRSPATLYSYRRTVDRLLIPAIGHIPISELTAHHLDTLYSGIQKGKRRVSASTVRRYNSVLSAALNQAIKWGWVDVNVATRITLAPIRTKSPEVPTPEEVRALITAAQAYDEQLGMFLLLAAITGCRRGELAALRWSDIKGDLIIISSSAYSVDQERGIKSTKSGRERTLVAGDQLNDILRSWRDRCEEIAADQGIGLPHDAFLFSARADGQSPINIDTVSTNVRKIADSLDPPLHHVHLHSLRHFAATELLGAGVNARDAADRLGHSDPALTLRIYAHATLDRQRQAASHAENALGLPGLRPSGP
jgi:integrase